MRVSDHLVEQGSDASGDDTRLQSYKRLADVFSDVLSDDSVDTLLDRIADTLGELIPYDTLTIYEADEQQRNLVPVLARDEWADEIMKSRTTFGTGLTGWAAEHREPILANDAHLDPRVVVIPGTPLDPESIIVVPLVAREHVKGCLNIYRIGDDARFTDEEFELAKRFGDAAALALDNANIRKNLEQQAQSDPLTSLYNHRHFHERLRSELNRASRTHDATALLMFDIDDFKKINDVHGYSTGDQILVALAEILEDTVRGSDVCCRIGGEEFAVVLPSCDAGDAMGLAARLAARVAEMDFDPAGEVTLSIGIAQGPDHAMNPRELVACAESAMNTAKERGKNRIVLYDDTAPRPDAPPTRRDVRSIAHLKMLQSLVGKLNRSNDVRQIGVTISNELRTLIDYHSCRVYLRDEDLLVPIAWRGDLEAYTQENVDNLSSRVGEGITGHVAAEGRSLLIANALECEFAVTIPGTDEIEESIVAVPLTYAQRVIGAILISKLGVNQFDEDDLRLVEVLAGHASVALENARLYEAQRQEAESAKALLEFSDLMSKAASFHSIGNETARMAAKLMGVTQASLWMKSEDSGVYRCAAHTGYVGDDEAEQLLRFTVTEEQAGTLIAGRRAPFTMTPQTIEERFEGQAEGLKLKTTAIAPLHGGDGVKGWITVRCDNGPGFFTEDKLRLLSGLSYQSSIAMQKAYLYKEQKESAELANALLEFSRELTLTEGIDDVLSRIVEMSARLVGSPKTSVWLQEPETGDVVPEAQWGYPEPERERMAMTRFPEDIAAAWLDRPEPFFMRPEDLAKIPGAEDISNQTMVAIAPIRIDGRLGAIAAVAPALGDYEFSERKMRLLAGLAHQAKLAIMNATSFETLERTFFETVEALANALEAKDEYTSTHARSITDMALDVGHELGIEGRDLKRLELGALFHDIGKIGIPSAILSKPGPLDDDEWKVIRTHPELGERILEPIDRLADVRPIVRACHEHFDGSGYPDQKKGDEIPIESRIILVVDAFDAMTTDRSYRKALPTEEAVRRLRESAGRQFDPLIVEAFLRTLEPQESES